MTQEPHKAYKIVTLPYRDDNLTRHIVYCIDPSHPNGEYAITRTITRWGAKWAAREHFTSQRVKESVERYNID